MIIHLQIWLATLSPVASVDDAHIGSINAVLVV